MEAALVREFDVTLAEVDDDCVALDRWWARSIVTEGVDDVVRDDWCADGMGRTVAGVERTVTSSDDGSPIAPARAEKQNQDN